MVRFLLNFSLTLFGICIIATLPVLFRADLSLLNIQLFFKELFELLKSFLSPSQITYISGMTERIILKDVFPYLKYSTIILISAYTIAILLGITLGIILSYKSNKIINKTFDIIRAIPDITVFFFLQWFFLLIYKETGILLFQIAGGFENSYFIPILSLIFIPTLYFFKITLLLVSQELTKEYIEYAKSKGLSKSSIVRSHLFPNIKLQFFNYLKPGFWYTLSNLVVLEIIFNIQGVVWFILNHQSTEVIAFTLILFLIPFHIIFSAIEAYIKKTDLRMNY
ncbi:ABC transporter permease subunit [Fictibacillus phosphorivorans]|uniref:ABC transporter permease subunit n=1 Tax=Fictibacillus phosphorivorans TaxID=1221500 RepID=UPI003CF14390